MRSARSLRGHVCSVGLALVLALVPAAPALCGLMCASHAPETATSEHHSCHPSSEDTTQVQPLPHACGHDTTDPVGVRELIHVLNPPAFVTPITMTTLVIMDLQRQARLASHSEQHPPGSPTLTAPLRV